MKLFLLEYFLGGILGDHRVDILSDSMKFVED
jgi:hypothetical protein